MLGLRHQLQELTRWDDGYWRHQGNVIVRQFKPYKKVDNMVSQSIIKQLSQWNSSMLSLWLNMNKLYSRRKDRDDDFLLVLQFLSMMVLDRLGHSTVLKGADAVSHPPNIVLEC